MEIDRCVPSAVGRGQSSVPTAPASFHVVRLGSGPGCLVHLNALRGWVPGENRNGQDVRQCTESESQAQKMADMGDPVLTNRFQVRRS